MKRIVLFSDGTGNAASAIWRTNVRRMFEAIDLRGNEQVAFYDDGVGTSSFKPLALLGGAFGWGLKRNVLDLYMSVCRNYRDNNDEIFAFGFSRGAFTIRVLLGFMLNQGLVPYDTEGELQTRSVAAYRQYRREKFHSVLGIESVFRWIRDRFIRTQYDKTKNRELHAVRFVGVWDTVSAYGLPIEEMTRGFSQWIWPLELPDRQLHPKVKRACHALSLDDERTTFHPVLWDEANETPIPRDAAGVGLTKAERITQIWFSGVHANVGGGYPDDSLAYVPLNWIMREAGDCGLSFKVAPNADPDFTVNVAATQDKDGRIYDPRQGLGGYYRYGPRKVQEFCNMRLSKEPADKVEIALPKIHESVLQRIRNEVNPYAPIGLPPRYEVVDAGRRILPPHGNPYESAAQAMARADAQEHVWNYVWIRRLIYFAAIFTSFYLALYPLIRKSNPAGEFSSPIRPVSDVIGILRAFLPDALDVWLKAYQRAPGRFLATLAVLVLFILIGTRLRNRINDEMRSTWRQPTPGGLPNDAIYRLRSHRWYRRIHDVLRRHVLPAILAALMVYVVTTFASHALFTFADAAGLICKASPTAQPVTTTYTFGFDTRAACQASGAVLQEGERYRISIRILDPAEWRDNEIHTTLGGYYTTDQSITERTLLTLAWPLKRALIRPWFRVIARVGTTGNDEEFLDADDSKSATDHSEIIRARQTGELFVYLNDATLAIPYLYDVFYSNNGGRAEITIEKR